MILVLCVCVWEQGEQEAKEWVGALNTYVENNNLQKKIEQKRAARKY